MSDHSKPVSFSWDLHYACNYRCPYCWWHGRWPQLAAMNQRLTPEEWFRHWERIYKDYGSVRISIIGGEPFIYPHFHEMVKLLSALHTMLITTNLSTNIDRFSEEIDSEKVKISPTFHPTFADFDTFLKKCVLLKAKGFTENVNYLAYPPQIKLLPSFKEKFNQAGLKLCVMTFWGTYAGKEYPGGYTDEERQIVSPELGKRNNEEFQLSPVDVFKDKICAAGHRYGVIQADGTVLRCGGSGLNEKIGNFFDENFKLQDKPYRCNAQFCKCNEWAEFLEKEKSDVSGTDISGEGWREKVGVPIPIPRYPRLAYPYKVHWNWEPTFACNYKCSYCTVRVEHEGEKTNYLSVQAWKDIWEKLFDDYGSSHIRFSGGEPFVYPNFMDLLNMLLSKHTIDVTTNLSFDAQELIDKVAPEEISISASFHPDHVSFEDYLQKVRFLNKNRFPTDIAYVAYPPHLCNLERYRKLCADSGVMLKIIPFNGELNGKKYPRDYSPEETQLLQENINNTENQFQKELNKQWYSQNLNQQKESGKLCRMGQLYAKINPTGKVTRCCVHQSQSLGNIFDGTVRLLDDAQPCDATCNCPCFKAMLVVGDEGKWHTMWPPRIHHLYKMEYLEKIAAVFKSNKLG